MRVSGRPRVFDEAVVSGEASVKGSAWVYENSRVYDRATVKGNSYVHGSSRVYGNSVIKGNAGIWVSQDRRVIKGICISKYLWISDPLRLC